MRDEAPLHGLTAVIPHLNRLAQGHERYDVWLQAAMTEADEGKRTWTSFDSERFDRLEDLQRLSDMVVESWVKARGVAPIGQ